MKLKANKKCTGCMACYNACPKDCISFIEGNDGFLYPNIDESRCIKCHKCEYVCKNLTRNNFNEQHKTYIGLSENFQNNCSSGGAFGELARQTIKNGGVVYGASFAEDFMVEHIRVDTLEEIHKLFRSKYVQSYVGDVLKAVKRDLLDGRQVLFAGTSCQIAGLKSFLASEDENLITVGLICHGVPSPNVWKKYLRKKSSDKKIKEINFRDKIEGWGPYHLTIEYADGQSDSERASENQYMRLFSGNFILRNACYKCDFRGDNRCEDITLGDCWSSSGVYEDINGAKNGVSLIIINSLRGKKIIELCRPYLNIKEAEFTDAIGYNTSYFCTAYRPLVRNSLSKDISGVDDINNQLCLIEKPFFIAHRLYTKIKFALAKRAFR